MTVRPKLRQYAISIPETGTPANEDGGELRWDGRWTPEHLVLAALARCTLIALEYHARRDSVAAAGAAAVSGVVGPRDDLSWGFVEIDCELAVTLDPSPSEARLPALLARAERGCFVGQSLTVKPRYRWTVNGEAVS